MRVDKLVAKMKLVMPEKVVARAKSIAGPKWFQKTDCISEEDFNTQFPGYLEPIVSVFAASKGVAVDTVSVACISQVDGTYSFDMEILVSQNLDEANGENSLADQILNTETDADALSGGLTDAISEGTG